MVQIVLVALLAVASIPATARAQAPFPGAVNIDGGWVPCSHPIAIARGMACLPQPGVPDDTTPPTDDECKDVNPYTQQELAQRCANRPTPADAVPTFLVGHVYAYGYDEVRARILGVSTDIDGVQVVTLRWLDDQSSIEARRTPATPGGSTVWRHVGR